MTTKSDELAVNLCALKCLTRAETFLEGVNHGRAEERKRAEGLVEAIFQATNDASTSFRINQLLEHAIDDYEQSDPANLEKE
jgi:hypothetical protein